MEKREAFLWWCGSELLNRRLVYALSHDPYQVSQINEFEEKTAPGLESQTLLSKSPPLIISPELEAPGGDVNQVPIPGAHHPYEKAGVVAIHSLVFLFLAGRGDTALSLMNRSEMSSFIISYQRLFRLHAGYIACWQSPKFRWRHSSLNLH